MSDYKTMYYKLFNAMTDAIQILQQAQQASEELYISIEEYTEKDNKNSDHT